MLLRASVICLSSLSMMAVTLPASAASIPLHEDFNGQPTGQDTPVTQGQAWQEDGDWSIVTVTGETGNQRYQAPVLSSSGTGTAYAWLTYPDAPGTDFEIRTDIVLNEFDGAAASIGITFLGDAEAGGGYTLDFFATGGANDDRRLRLRRGTTTTRRSDAFTAVATGTVYSLMITGTYATPNSLTIVAELTDADSNVITLEWTDTEALQGSRIGYRAAVFAGDIDVEVDNFSVVPEPSSLSLLGLSVLGLRRRR